MPETWKVCSVCKKPIPVGGKWFKCSVSTCNSARIPLVFCSMTCWDAHVPTQNHRAGVWATEERAPLTVPPPAGAAPPAAPTAERRLVRGPGTSPERPDEVLIVVSRLKDFVRDQADFNVAGDVPDVLSDLVREAVTDAIRQARAEGRRTVMARDFKR